MQVREIMEKNIEYFSPDKNITDAAKAMSEHNFGFIPVGENDRLIGSLTDRDIAIRAVAEGKNPKETKIRDVMTKKVRYCFEDDDIEKAAEYMCQEKIRRLVVLNKDKRMVGIVSLSDLAARSQDLSLCGHVLESISKH